MQPQQYLVESGDGTGLVFQIEPSEFTLRLEGEREPIGFVALYRGRWTASWSSDDSTVLEEIPVLNETDGIRLVTELEATLRRYTLADPDDLPFD